MSDAPKLTVIAGGSPDPVLRTRPRRTCRHRGVFEVDEDAGVVTCVGCDKPIDPVIALGVLANEWKRQDAAVSSLRDERKRLEAEIDELKRQRRNLKAQIRRAR